MRQALFTTIALVGWVALGCGGKAVSDGTVDAGVEDAGNPADDLHPPDAPTDVTATADVRSALVTWKAPLSNGGSPVTGYTVTANDGKTKIDVDGRTLRINIVQLANGKGYQFTVKAKNAVGESAESPASTEVKTPDVPVSPTDVKVTPGNGQAAVSWTAPSSNGGRPITGYSVTAMPGGRIVRVDGNTTSAPVTGLINGTTYTLTVVAINAAGKSAESMPVTVTPAQVPSAPTGAQATAGIRSATVTWKAPTNTGGSALTGYIITTSPGATKQNVPATDLTATVTGLANGTSYSFSVQAVNAVGTGGSSVSSNVITTPDLPSAPTGVKATRGNASATVTWNAPASDGGQSITGYTIITNPGALKSTVAAGTLSTQITNLTNGTAYTFTVYASTAVGDGPNSLPSNLVRPATVPDAPTNVAATVGVRSATITWSAPAKDGGSPITAYSVVASPGGSQVNVPAGVLTAQMTNLLDGTAYTFTVIALNSVGASQASAPSTAVTTPNVPTAPASVTATPGFGKATVSWTASPNDGGSPVTNYTIKTEPGGAVITVSGITFTTTISGLTNGTPYTFTVRATNAVGDGLFSNPSTAVTPAQVPGSPTDVSATPLVRGATVSWTAPTDDGGSTITGYTVTANPGGATATATAGATSVNITKLSDGTAYTFTVVATNAIGSGNASQPSLQIVTPDIPGAPKTVSATAGNQQATVTWTSPADDGGSPVTGYTVTANPGGEKVVTDAKTFSAIVKNLTNGTAYTFTVFATSDVGDGVPKGSAPAVTPAAGPDAPANVSAVAGIRSATVSWSASVDNGSPITGYTVTVSPGGQTVTVGGNVLTTSVSGLSNGTSYTFTVTATNSLGTSNPSLPSSAVTTPDVPSAPTTPKAQPGNNSATVTWGTATDNGSPVTSYTVTTLPGGATQTVGGGVRSLQITGLANGTSYTFTIEATNALGNGPKATTNSVVPATLADPPTNVSATVGVRTATVTWTAPTNTGGSAIVGYTATAYPGGKTVSVSGSTLTADFTGLSNATSYTFTVYATNASGNSVESAPSSAVVTPDVPGAPTNVTGVRGNGKVDVSWSAPSSDGGRAISKYTVTATPGGASVSVASGTTATLTGLTNGTAYTFTVVATNAVGDSAPSAKSAAVTPATVPGAPTGVTASSGVKQISVSWSAPLSDGGSTIISYTVTANPGGATASVDGSTLTATVTGLSSGTAYTFTVVATNSVGPGAASAPSSAVSTSGVPTPPQNVTATPGNGQASVSWQAPAGNGGSTITGYTVTASPGGAQVTVGGTTLNTTVPGLTNGTAYTFTVVATNAVGNSSPSTASTAVTPATNPGAPTGVAANAGVRSATVVWQAPASNGGSALTGYTVTASPGGATATVNGTTLTATVTGLSDNTSYTFTVVATNPVGSSVPSQPSSAVKTPNVPDAPTNVTATGGLKQASVSWTASANNGGSAITGYTVTSSPGNVSASVGAAATSATVTGLADATVYTFRVVATNAVGNSAASAPSNQVKTAAVPDAPTNVVAAGGYQQASITWSAPVDDGGSPITGYTVTSNDGKTVSVSGASTLSATMTGLTDATTYTFTVKATNAVGTGVASANSNAATTAAVPGAPTNVTATGKLKSADLTWTAPASNGGDAIIDYEITASPAITAVVVTSTSTTVTGLTDATSYTFTVKARNRVGKGAGGNSNATSTYATPGAPTAVTAVAGTGNGEMTVSWTAPASNGGTAITSYTVSSNASYGADLVFSGQPANGDSVVLSSTAGGSSTFTFKTTAAAGEVQIGLDLPTTLANFVSSLRAVAGSKYEAAVTSATTVRVRADSFFSGTNGDTVLVTVSSSAITRANADADGTFKLVAPATATTADGTTTTAKVTGLQNGMPYTFTVVGTNAVGVGSASTASAAVRTFTVPAAPTNVNATVGVKSATVTWAAPGAYSGPAVTGYTISGASTGGTALTPKTVSAATSSVTFTGLANNTSYRFSVVATNSIGSGTGATATTSLTANVPGAPTSVSATGGVKQATVTWTVPASNGGDPITGYVITSTPDNVQVTVSGAGATTGTVTGLRDGISYTFSVVAQNGAGDSAPGTSNSTTTASVPGAPTSVTASGGVKQATVSWTAPASTGGSAITGYTVTSTPGNVTATVSGTTTTTTITGLADATSYTFSVVATNAVGNGPAGTSGSTSTASAPSAPTSVAASNTNNTVTATWAAPSSNGGSAVTGYTVTLSPGGQSTSVSASTFTASFPNLVGGKLFTVSVAATNVVGTGSAATATTTMVCTTLAFPSPALTRSSGASPHHAVVADFNGDGILDTAVANYTGNNLSVMLGVGDGTFGAPATYALGTHPRAIAVGLFNADALPDLAVTNEGSNSVSVLLGKADGTFNAKVDFTTDASPWGVTTGDFNGDNKTDIATANSGGSTVSIFLGNGTGGFGARNDFATGNGAINVAVGDVDKDGKLDVVAANYNAATISVLTGKGNGTFNAKVDYATGSQPHALFIGDLNGDTFPDVAVANYNSATVSVLLGTGTGGALAAKADYGAGQGPYDLAVKDLNGDSRPDLIVANATSSTVSVLLASSGGGYQTTVDYRGAESTVAVTTGDFNGDSKVDVLNLGGGAGVGVLLGKGDGTFPARTELTVGSNPTSVLSVDVNKDNKLDLVTTDGSQKVSVLLGDGTGGFGTKTDFGVGANPLDVASGDFNADGNVDLVVANGSGNNVSVLLGAGNGSFGTKTDFATAANADGVAVSDLNGDGKLDVAVAAFTAGKVSILLGKGDGTFNATVDYPSGSGASKVAIADLNGDGKKDLVLVNQTAPNASVLFGVGDGTFLAATVYVTGSDPIHLALADVNGDTHLDLITANWSANTLSVLTGNADGTFNPKVDYATGTNPRSIAVADFNRDGKLDLAANTENGNTVSLLLGNGDSTFNARRDYAAGQAPWAVTGADFNGDGNPDLATANFGTSTSTVMLNTCLK